MVGGEQAWQEAVASAHISRLHNKVSEALAGLGVQHEIECVTDDGLFCVDIMLRHARVAVDVDGPYHFTANTLQPLGMPTRSLPVALLKSKWPVSCLA